VHGLLPLACFAAAIITVLAAVGAAGAGLLFWLGRSPKFRRMIGGSERHSSDHKFYWSGEDVVARTNAMRELAAKHGYEFDGSVVRAPDFTLFTHTFEDGEHTTTHIVLRIAMQLPPFTLASRTFFDSRGITFDDPDFSERFFIESADEPALRKLLQPNVRRTIIDAQTWRMESDGNELRFRDPQHMTVEGLERFVDDSMRVVKVLR
jgi:hypothetical protein